MTKTKRFFCLFLVLFVSASLAYGAESKLCLTMIVKNESRIIERCLNSVKDVIDYIVICDTGSTDNTVEIVEQFLQEHEIPGAVHRHEWRNFGYNRTLSVQAAQETLAKHQCELDQTYLLLLDADMLLVADEQFTKNALQTDSYLVLQQSSSLAYYNTRLIRASLPWESRGVTHEYWACPSLVAQGTLSTLMINDQGDGGCKEDKFTRDLELLTQGLEDEPHNPRYMFYLAQTYKCLRNYNEAIHWYKSRIDRGGWREEVWYSKYMIAECYEELGYWNHALTCYLDAYDYHPTRAEPLWKIANHYRLSGESALACLFAKQGKAIPYPKDDLLFISHPVYTYQFDEELAVAAYYTPFKEEGMEAVNRLLLNREVPQSVKEWAHRTALYYVQNLPDASYEPIAVELPPLREGSDAYYCPLNPSIQKTDRGYNLICRAVNYTQKGGTGHRSRDPDDSTIRTKNFFLEYDKKLKLLSQKEITETLSRPRHSSQVEGLEDCRLVEMNGESWFTCSTFDYRPATVSQVLCKLGGKASAQRMQVKTFVPMDGGKNWCEKNWLPFSYQGELCVVYLCDPFTVYQVDKKTGACKLIKEYMPPLDLSRFRGSAAPIAFEDGYLMMIHEVVVGQERTYLHRFVYLDQELNLKKLSKPFTFQHQGVEYCCGMATDHSQTECILSVGIEDREAHLCRLSLETIRSLLEPVNNCLQNAR
ncbi:MAG: hypothetical protein S4CHLAM2_03860 [Chlamydiales bacterium]|nr:hypothetical protein [Chlamydiales bacterium]